MRTAFGLGGFLLLCFVVAVLGAAATTPEIAGWYRTIAKPRWNPPDAVFGPVWTVRYVMMAIAAWWVWRPAGFRGAAGPLTLFFFQLALYGLLSWSFFAWHRGGWAFAEIAVLWVVLAATTLAFFAQSRVAGWLMTPYLAWVSFASYLNFAIWRLNS